MNLTFIQKKQKYYIEWYQSMTNAEKRSIVGRWVYENVQRYHEVINTAMRQAA